MPEISLPDGCVATVHHDMGERLVVCGHGTGHVVAALRESVVGYTSRPATAMPAVAE